MTDKFQALNVCVTASAAAKISSQEITTWVNETLQTDVIYKVHELGTGEHYCLLLNMLFPLKEPIALRKVKFGSKIEVDHINNWKFFQTGLKSVGIDKELSIDKLVKQKPMDNLEFAQWFYKFFDANRTTDTDAYDPVVEREKRGIVLERCLQHHFNTSPQSKPGPQESRLMKFGTLKKLASPNARTMNGGYLSSPESPTKTMPSNAAVMLKSEVNRLKGRVDEMALSIEGLEKERDFYFSKLRDIEIKCQENSHATVLPIKTVFDILYSTEEGFAPPV